MRASANRTIGPWSNTGARLLSAVFRLRLGVEIAFRQQFVARRWPRIKTHERGELNQLDDRAGIHFPHDAGPMNLDRLLDYAEALRQSVR